SRARHFLVVRASPQRGRDAFPRRDGARFHSEYRMRCWHVVAPARGFGRAALVEFGPEVPPLELELTVGDLDDARCVAGPQDSGRIETVPSRDRLGTETDKVAP